MAPSLQLPQPIQCIPIVGDYVVFGSLASDYLSDETNYAREREFMSFMGNRVWNFAF